MKKQWTADNVLELMRHYQPACVLAAAAELELFDALAPKPVTAGTLARALKTDLRGTTVLLDALVALQLLDKRKDLYAVPPRVAALLTAGGKCSVLAMAQHQANCLRRWAQ